jgi:hypothetical protein
VSNTFGLCPQPSKPKRNRSVVSFQTRLSPNLPWGPVTCRRATQDAEGILAIQVRGRVASYPRGLWRLA